MMTEKTIKDDIIKLDVDTYPGIADMVLQCVMGYIVDDVIRSQNKSYIELR